MDSSDVKVPEEDTKECSEGMKLLSEITEGALEIKGIFEMLSRNNYQTAKGMNFLEVKFHLLLDYIINLAYIALKKVAGNRIEDDPTVERVVEMRTVLEKMKPIDVKLRHHISKLLDTVATGTINPNDPLRFRPNPKNMVFDETDSGSGDEEEEKPKSNVYVPPKITAMHYDGDETLQQRKQKALEKAQKRALSSSILYELKKQYDDGPEEIRETASAHKLKESKKIKERIRFEEDFMTRLPVTKKQRHDANQGTIMSDLRNIAKFEDITALDMSIDDVPLNRKEPRKSSAKKGKRKSFRNRRRRH